MAGAFTGSVCRSGLRSTDKGDSIIFCFGVPGRSAVKVRSSRSRLTFSGVKESFGGAVERDGFSELK